MSSQYSKAVVGELREAVAEQGAETFLKVVQKHGIALKDAVSIPMCVSNCDSTKPLNVFQLAAVLGNALLVDLLCRQGASVNTRDMEETLMTAVSSPDPLKVMGITYFSDCFCALPRPAKGLLQVINTLLKHGVVLKEKRALHYAVQLGNPDIVRLLCANGADANAYEYNIEDKTILHSAAWMTKPDVVQVLCECGADVNKPNRQGDIPLHYAVWTPISSTHLKKSIRLVKLLCELGSDINRNNEDGKTPISRAARHSKIQDICRAYQVVHPNQGCVTPLHTAVHTGNALMVREICNVHGTDVNTEDDNGRTPLFSAAQKGRTNIVEILCAHGADTNKAPRWKSTPLHCAALVGCKEAVKTLCEHGANVNALNVFGETALNFAAQGGYAEVIRTLCQHGADFNAPSKGTIPLSVFKYHQMDAATEMLKHWFPSHVDEDGYSALHYACYSPEMQTGHPDLVRMLLEERQCDCDVRDTSNNMTALHWILFQVDLSKQNLVLEFLETFRILIAAGCSMGEGEASPCSSLLREFSMALSGHHPLRQQEVDGLCDCLKLLVSAGINPTEEDFDLINKAGNPSLVPLAAGRGVQEYAAYVCRQPVYLTRLCKLAIRKTMRKPLTCSVPQLQFPPIIEEYLLLEMLDYAPRKPSQK